jgi:NAD(P)-dependent dehydrogenase (short-subunit alcohol dehydrogenase family)
LVLCRAWTCDLEKRKIPASAMSPGVEPTPGYDQMGLTKEQLQGFVDLMVTSIPPGRVGRLSLHTAMKPIK